jgi:hypothetical protein
MNPNHHTLPPVFATPLAEGEPDPTATLGDPRDYDPAAYRWVPVRRVPRYDGWTEEKQRRFIEVLADTGQVRLACAAVKLSRESAYKLRRATGGEAFAAAWDAARLHAVHAIEDVAFERAIEGTEMPLFNRDGEQIATRSKYNDRLLMFLLRHLKPETYGRAAQVTPPPMPKMLRALEPALPAPPETMLSSEALADELEIADIAEGTLPHWLDEQRNEASDPRTGMAPDALAEFERLIEQAKRDAANLESFRHT